MLTHGSLFAGIGGFDLGFERANIKTIWQVENDPYCLKVLERHWLDVQRYGDVERIERLEGCDILTAGFPCQDLSVAGKRKGLAGARSGLFWEIIRIARKVLPRWILIENVPGLFSSDDGRDFGIVLTELGKLGYGLAWRVFNSQYLGVPQRRRRVFIVGYFGAVCPGEILFESEGGAGDIKAGGEEGPGVAAPVTTRIGGSGSGWPRYDEEKHLVVYEENTRDEMRVRQSPPTVMNYGGKQKPLITAPLGVRSGTRGGGSGNEGKNLIAETITGGYAGGRSHGKQSGADRQTMVINALQFSGGPDDNDAQAGHIVAAPLTARDAKGPLPDRALGTVVWHNKQQSGEVREYDDISPAVTQQWGTGGNNAAMVGVRRLTPRECERLQGFPDDWTRWDAEGNEISDSPRYRMLGNAVTVNVAEWLAKRIIEFEKSRVY